MVNILKVCLCMEFVNNWCLCRVKLEMNEVFFFKFRGELFKFKRRLMVSILKFIKVIFFC